MFAASSVRVDWIRVLAGAIGLALFAVLPCASTAAADESLVLEKFSERLSKDVPVSGRMLVGAVVPDAATARPGLAPRLLWGNRASESAAEGLCVTFASRDGQYFGEGEITAEKLALQRGPVRVRGEHNTETAGHLRTLGRDELAMLATRGDCRLGSRDAKAPTTVHLLDRRETATTAPPTALLMLNSLTYTLALEASENGGAPRALVCTLLEGAQRNKAFNTLCELPLSAKDGAVDLVIKRRRFERGFPELKFRLLWSLS